MKLSRLVVRLRRLMALPFYGLIQVIPLGLFLSGHRRSRIGTCTLWAPRGKMGVILDGMAFLESVDPVMFKRVTAERRYVFWYNPKGPVLQAAKYFAITDKYLYWGQEGVAIFFVQCMLDFTLKYLPQLRNLAWSPADTLAARSEIQGRLSEWIKQHPFPAELVVQYEKLAERYEQTSGKVPGQ